jgi:hypothetical protein
MPLVMEFEFRGQRYQDAQKGLEAFGLHMGQAMEGQAQTLTRELKDFLDQVAQALDGRHSGPWPSGTTAQTLSKRSGALMSAITGSVRTTGDTLNTVRGEIGTPGIPYGAIQEYGGKIVPKTAKYLAIPLPAALNANGTPMRKGPREWPNTFCAMSRNGNLIIFQRRGTNVVPLYVLKTSVIIPPRLGMRKTLDVGIPYFVERAMDAMVKDIIAKVG